MEKAVNSFNYLPAYATFLSAHYLEEFAMELLKLFREEKVPLLYYFQFYTEKELVELGKTSASDLLGLIAKNKIKEYIENSAADWIANKLSIIERDQIIAEDITLISLVRRKAFRNFLKFYTQDLVLFSNVMEDVDRFVALAEATSFNAYINIQQANIKKINQELETQHAELIEAQKASEMGSFFWDIKEGNSSFSPSLLEIFAITGPSNLDSFFKNVHPSDHSKLQAAIDKALNTDGLYECEYTYLRNGMERRIWSRGVVRFEDGEPLNMKGTIMDVTNKYQLLERLQQSEELHKQAQALTHIGNWTWDIATNRITWSDEMYRIYGLAPQSEEISYERFVSFIHPNDREQKLLQLRESLETRQVPDYILRIKNHDNSIKILKGKGEVLTDNNNKPLRIVGTCQDITQEHQLHKELQEKEENLKSLINNAPDAVIVIDKNSIITLWNPKTEEIFGWKADEVIGKSLTETIIPQKYQEAHLKGMARYLDTGEAPLLNKTLELSACNKNKKEFYISLTISKTVQMGNLSFVAFLRDISKEKQTRLDLQNKTTLLEYKNIELERTNKELESFNYAASHDLQEPLRKIQIFTSRIVSRGKDSLPPEILSDFDKIIASSARMQDLIEDLLALSKTTLASELAHDIDLNELIREVEVLLSDTIKEKQARIDVGKLPMLRLVPFQFSQLFINLVDNAMKYQQEKLTPRIEITSTLVKSTDIALKSPPPYQNYILLRIADNGIGFESKYAEKIFDPFIRLHSKDKYKGTGIGLSICKKIVHNHEGFIIASSEKGNGSVFSIYLPEKLIVR